MKNNIVLHSIWGTVTLAIVVASIVSVSTTKKHVAKYEEEILNRDATIAELKEKWEELGPMATGLVAKEDVRGGEELRVDNWEEYFTEVSYPEKLNVGTVSADLFATPKYLRAGLSEGTVVSADDILDTRLEDSERYYDIFLDEYPIGLLPGTYIDIRVRFPFGQDFIALNHKRVEELNGTSMKLVISEQELYTYNSMLTDKVLYDAQIYAVEYIDTGSQQAADTFYPLNYNMQELLSKNPNALNIVKESMKLDRELLEAEMQDTVPEDIEEKKAYFEGLEAQLAGLRASNSALINGQQAIFTARWAAEQAAKAAGLEGGDIAPEPIERDWSQKGR